MRVEELDAARWRRLLSSSWGPPGLYPARRRLALHTRGGSILVGLSPSPGRLAAWSLGRDAAGGAACTGSACRDHVSAALLLEAVSGDYGCVCVTLQEYNPFTRGLLRELLGAGWWRLTTLYPRILDLTPYRGDPGLYVSRLPKKSRNRWRSFMRRGGSVEELSRPSRHAAELYAVLNSTRRRQGRPVPRKWSSPRWVARLAAWMDRGVSEGWLRVYAAYMGGRMAGFTCIQLTRLQGLVTWFLIHPAYARHGAGNALLTEAVMRLASRGGPPLLQYGYHRPVNPGLNRFLERQLFTPLREAVVCSRGPLAPLLHASKPILDFAEKTSSRLATLLYHAARESLHRGG